MNEWMNELQTLNSVPGSHVMRPVPHTLASGKIFA